jgi:hypothetical protein
MEKETKIKVCTICKLKKAIELFHIDKRRSDGHTASCRECNNSAKKLSGSKRRADKKYYESNKTELLEKNKEYRNIIKNDEGFKNRRKEYYNSRKEHFLNYKKQWYIQNKDHHLVLSKKYYETHKELVLEKSKDYYNNRRRKDPFFKMKDTIRNRVKQSIRNKKMNSETILGCDWETFEKHIESQFLEGMNWNNNGRGKDKWHFDHHIPVSSACSEAELYKLNHYTNFKPLWEKDNLKKSNKISEEWGNA